MADRPRADDWWQASDGKWYPPDLIDSPKQEFVTTEMTPVVGDLKDKVVRPGFFAQATVAAAGVASAAMAVSGIILVPDIRAATDPLFTNGVIEYPESAAPWAATSLFQALAFLLGAISAVVWLFRTSKALGAREPEDRRWSPGWSIGGWFIPFASLVIPKLVVGEIERLAAVPYRGVPIGDAWKSVRRSRLGDLWWLLWVAGNVVTLIGIFGLGDEPTNGAIATAVTVESIGALFLAGAAACFVILMRRIVNDANS